ncbi:hypothetical protein O6H91_03G064200 [Diphasiastrum complanatum]|uniref:Uncharacterized protein n=2 Tax=Diphasiastrum complanatum TaxID=34168 RepID=A0ACC2E738_DIPCM|nr:hypothetical protein O6H91_03G064000 [Diphasiastrum complanatum]KAJ7562322.1 hypothetical protein O6H91_03G064200 [Diphasiastrum complanatum]
MCGRGEAGAKWGSALEYAAPSSFSLLHWLPPRWPDPPPRSLSAASSRSSPLWPVLLLTTSFFSAPCPFTDLLSWFRSLALLCLCSTRSLLLLLAQLTGLWSDLGVVLAVMALLLLLRWLLYRYWPDSCLVSTLISSLFDVRSEAEVNVCSGLVMVLHSYVQMNAPPCSAVWLLEIRMELAGLLLFVNVKRERERSYAEIVVG